MKRDTVAASRPVKHDHAIFNVVHLFRRKVVVALVFSSSDKLPVGPHDGFLGTRSRVYLVASLPVKMDDGGEPTHLAHDGFKLSTSTKLRAVLRGVYFEELNVRVVLCGRVSRTGISFLQWPHHGA